MRIHIPALAQNIEAARGDNLYRVLAAAGLLDAPCGGQGRCGHCAVRFLSVPPPAQKCGQSLLSEGRLQAGGRLSCRCICGDDDIEIELPPSSAAYAEGAFWTGGEPQLSGEEAEGLGLALDIGTTTLAALLAERQSGRLLASAACLNSQKAYGQDVISRISHAASPGGLHELQNAVLRDIAQLLDKLCRLAGRQTEEIIMATIAANPTMIHLLSGVDPAPLGRSPYRLTLAGPLELSARHLALPLAEEAGVYCLPAAAAYLGGDTVGGLVALEMDSSGPTRLLLDIGTNGEIVLNRQGRLWGCSTAAGPALEGMNIRCGMRAAAGAIEEVEIDEGRVLCRTIGGLPALGLAGSGLVSAVSALLRAGLLDSGGRLLLRAPVTERQGQRQLPLDAAAELALTQADIRQMQLAKAAIRSGLDALLQEAGCPVAEVEQVLVAGAFGAHLDAQSLLGTGLIPPEWAGKIRYAGNSSLAGARLCLLSARARHRAESLSARIDYLELATLKGYQQSFIQAMKF